jgi:hypothetical protein
MHNAAAKMKAVKKMTKPKKKRKKKETQESIRNKLSIAYLEAPKEETATKVSSTPRVMSKETAMSTENNQGKL